MAVTAAAAQSTIDPAKRFAYAANAAFINFKPDEPPPSGGAVVGERLLSGFVYAANFGWINLGDGSPANGIDYQNNSASDFGVNVLPVGVLSGFAYSANVGWINFEQTHGQPKIDLQTGVFSGFAWSGNIGWINLGGGGLATLSIAPIDTDGDGIGDEVQDRVLRQSDHGGRFDRL